MTGKRFKILCIDGGGIKGIFSASVLAKYEEIYGVKMTDYFDLIAGTSTGGIIALGASLGIPMSDIVKFYEEKGPAIFSCLDLPKTKLGKSLRELRMGIRQALIKSKYNSKNLESALREVFGDAVLKDSNNLLCIPSYKITTARNRIFKKDYGPYHTDNKLSYVDVALATAAAPTYFPIKEIDSPDWSSFVTLITDFLTCLHTLSKSFKNPDSKFFS
jgi:patatin-like phospholipase/acyl hydrolase